MTDKAPPAPAVGLSFDGEFTIGLVHLRSTDRGVLIRHEKVGTPALPKAKTGKDPMLPPSGFGVSGQLRVGAITLAVSSDYTTLRLLRDNLGHYTQTEVGIAAELLEDVFFSDSKHGEPAEREVSEAAVGGILDEAFFTRRIEKDGSVKTNLDRVREQKDLTSRK